MNKRNPLSSSEGLFSDVVWGIQHDAFEDPVSRSALRAYEHGVCDDLVAGILENRVEELQKHEALGQLNPFRIPRLCRGELVLGVEQIRIPLQWLVEHSLLVGNTGSGKTNLLLGILMQVALGGCAIWVSEAYKKHFRHLRPPFRRLGRELVILGTRDWKWNLLQASGDPRTHLTMAVDLLCRLPEMPSRARAILRQACHSLYQKFGIWSGNKDAWPTLFDLYEMIRVTAKLNEAAREAILDRLGVLLVSLTPKCAAYRLAWNPTDLARYSIIFEMRGAPEMVRQILLESSLFTLFQNEIERGVINGPLNLFLAFDDSQRFFDHSSGSEITGMDELAGIIRGVGIGLCICVQTMRGLSPKLVPNLATKMFGRLGANEDYESLGADIGLTQTQRDWAKLHLRPGVFVGQVGTGDWRQPFLFHTPLLNFPLSVKDEEAADSVRMLDCLPTVPAVEFTKWEPRSTIQLSSQSETADVVLTGIELRFLKAVVSQPGKSSSSYAKSVAINGRRAAEVRQRLAGRGYLREHSVATGARGRTAIVLEPLAPAFRATAQRQENGQ